MASEREQASVAACYWPKSTCTFDDDDDGQVVQGHEDVATHTVIRR